MGAKEILTEADLRRLRIGDTVRQIIGGPGTIDPASPVVVTEYEIVEMYPVESCSLGRHSVEFVAIPPGHPNIRWSGSLVTGWSRDRVRFANGAASAGRAA